ncbi:hypothetical protein BaRGS_00025790 [Batillaria attramentaria]|uniref:BPTI/Kunitz inhibitor domain-containing protein n=1 Tax=Batillaria attramentaria TaxID=370345 RepID=A0ABD0K7P0_9CAEN
MQRCGQRRAESPPLTTNMAPKLNHRPRLRVRADVGGWWRRVKGQGFREGVREGLSATLSSLLLRKKNVETRFQKTTMAKLQNFIMPVFLLAIVLVDMAAVHARICIPECGPGERCISANPRERRGRSGSVCVPVRCMTRARRGRCHHYTPHFTFDRSTLSCVPLATGACYGRSNRFRSHENCQLVCTRNFR